MLETIHRNHHWPVNTSTADINRQIKWRNFSPSHFVEIALLIQKFPWLERDSRAENYSNRFNKIEKKQITNAGTENFHVGSSVWGQNNLKIWFSGNFKVRERLTDLDWPFFSLFPNVEKQEEISKPKFKMAKALYVKYIKTQQI